MRERNYPRRVYLAGVVFEVLGKQPNANLYFSRIFGQLAKIAKLKYREYITLLGYL